MTAEVRVSKKGPSGGPTAEILVDSKVNASQLGALIQNVTTNKAVLSAAGLRACGGCKSGLDINIRDRFQEVIQVEV
ncbi:MAG TPA: hypothetical protein VFA33_15075 [Bryobacteraceae bacterium]|nr:hypothetical protein [Bryobacteraceae bacterium]